MRYKTQTIDGLSIFYRGAGPADAPVVLLRHGFPTSSFDEAALAAPEIAASKARYKPEKVWSALKSEGHFKAEAIKPFLTFPLDQRHIYYVDKYKWLNEARPEFAQKLPGNEWLITVPEPRKASETWPVYATTLINLHVHERGSVAFPRETVSDDLLANRDANIAEPAWRVLRDHCDLAGERSEHGARAFVGRLFRLAFAILHAPSYQAEHKSALSSDWAHLPISPEEDFTNAVVEAVRASQPSLVKDGIAWRMALVKARDEARLTIGQLRVRLAATLSDEEKRVVKALIAEGLRNQDIHALIPR